MTTSTIQQQEAAQALASIIALDRRAVVAHIGCAENHHTFAWASRQAINDASGAKIVLSLCADLPALHQSAIEIADEVLVLNLAGHIDARTLHELCAAYNQRKPIRWLEPWTMYCPACHRTGPESVHFFHSALSLRDLNDLFESLSQEQLTYLDGQLADWYGHTVPIVLLPDGYPAVQVDLTCTHCNQFARTAYAVAGEHGAWTTLLDADGTLLADLCDADCRVQVLFCPDLALQASLRFIRLAGGHYALGSPDGKVLLPGQQVEIVLAGYQIAGIIQAHDLGDYLRAEDGTTCGLCVSMRVVATVSQEPEAEVAR